MSRRRRRWERALRKMQVRVRLIPPVTAAENLLRTDIPMYEAVAEDSNWAILATIVGPNESACVDQARSKGIDALTIRYYPSTDIYRWRWV